MTGLIKDQKIKLHLTLAKEAGFSTREKTDNPTLFLAPLSH
jgi:hypothetical protein